MARIRSKDTKIELILAKALKQHGIRYRRHPKILGTPDFLIFNSKSRVLVFVDGDFWHGWDYEKKNGKLKHYWKKKIQRNMARDSEQRHALRKAGWKVLRLWGHEILKDMELCIEKIKRSLRTVNVR